MIRVVVDPGVLISALIGPAGSPPDVILSVWIDDRLEVIVSPKLIAELRRVVMRPKFRRWFDETAARQLIERIELHATLHPDPPLLEGATPDPADDYLVALALATRADAIVSGDRHLRDVPVATLLPRELAERLARSESLP
ncbi:MAG TPA: putative toxin-antitoxin system toxin component, PIN family [Conexibacter sp.]|nr:putative toxin-antitoxin system toxin component, PIN family [Conexibacter sp.]